MKALLTAIFLSTIGFTLACRDVVGAFEAAEIKPDILSEAPAKLLQIKYGKKKVDLGNEMTPTEVKDIPEIRFAHKEDGLYTLLMTDPDVPNRADPVEKEWHHWLVGNIPGNNICEGDVLAAYVGSAPAQGSGFHRYTFLVWEQPCKINFTEDRLNNTSVAGRARFSNQEFAAKYNLGAPIAGNFYYAKWDEWVPIIHEQLGVTA